MSTSVLAHNAMAQRSQCRAHHRAVCFCGVETLPNQGTAWSRHVPAPGTPLTELAFEVVLETFSHTAWETAPTKCLVQVPSMTRSCLVQVSEYTGHIIPLMYHWRHEYLVSCKYLVQVAAHSAHQPQPSQGTRSRDARCANSIRRCKRPCYQKSKKTSDCITT